MAEADGGRLRESVGLIFLLSVVLVAFGTALLTKAWDWLCLSPGARRLLADKRQAEREAERLGAVGRRPGELFEDRARGRLR